jgi:hypothetical protein
MICILSSCGSEVTQNELRFVESRAWVRSDPAGFSTAMFCFDTLTGPSFELENDTLFFYDGEFIGIISSVDTINEVLVLRSSDGQQYSNYKKTNRRRQ